MASARTLMRGRAKVRGRAPSRRRRKSRPGSSPRGALISPRISSRPKSRLKRGYCLGKRTAATGRQNTDPGENFEAQERVQEEAGEARGPARRGAYPGHLQQHDYYYLRAGWARGILVLRRIDWLQGIAQGNALRSAAGLGVSRGSGARPVRHEID